jgi:predicted TIM-barrel fold metal-dependent hydrolase
VIGLDNIMWESDFPHGTGTYPHSRERIEKATQDWTPEERRRVLVETPRQIYHL